ncbi:MAG: FAD-dependent oxidoreductase [Chloroherpetonaceae bacterium]|nr:FAD-dependent oxidoreductase [Chthonomonadaceae bacterium]MDW8208828.1 FAD-dependent oxidoreductase [Chloroherpetonaceae bacterium]
METLTPDILIVGASAGGVAAALAAAEASARVCLLEETEWPGGQLTTQGVCTPDENAWIETFGCTRRYARFRDATRDFYRTHYRLAPEAAADPQLNIGNCWVSRIAYLPADGAAILRTFLEVWEQQGRLQCFYRAQVLNAQQQGDRVTGIHARLEDGTVLCFTPRYVLDATDTGELLALCGQEGLDWVVGAESRAQTGEPDALDTPRPDWVQPFTFPFALDWSPETVATNVIAPPPDYAELRALQRYRIAYGAITGLFQGPLPWWSYRRVMDKSLFDDPRVTSDLAMINTPGNDYYGGNVLGPGTGDAQSVAATLARARRAALGYLYWLQTECPREDGNGRGYPEFRLRTDVFPTPDGCAIRPYIRESRRIRALRPILEQEIVVQDFSGNACRGELARAAFMEDSVGIGHYALDIHPNGHGEPERYVATRPFQIPLGALIPIRWENLLPACKNLGTTHLTNGAYRLHPIEWNVGESAGLLAAWCVQHHVTPRTVYQDHALRRHFQQTLLHHGIPLHWYVDVPVEHPAFVAVQTLAGYGFPLGNPADLLFCPDEPIDPDTYRQWRDAMGNGPVPFAGTRAEAAQCLYEATR